MISVDRVNNIQKAQQELAKIKECDRRAQKNLSAACKRALDSGATLREVGLILGLSRERTRQIASQVQPRTDT